MDTIPLEILLHIYTYICDAKVLRASILACKWLRNIAMETKHIAIYVPSVDTPIQHHRTSVAMQWLDKFKQLEVLSTTNIDNNKLLYTTKGRIITLRACSVAGVCFVPFKRLECIVGYHGIPYCLSRKKIAAKLPHTIKRVRLDVGYQCPLYLPDSVEVIELGSGFNVKVCNSTTIREITFGEDAPISFCWLNTSNKGINVRCNIALDMCIIDDMDEIAAYVKYFRSLALSIHIENLKTALNKQVWQKICSTNPTLSVTISITNRPLKTTPRYDTVEPLATNTICYTCTAADMDIDVILRLLLS